MTTPKRKSRRIVLANGEVVTLFYTQGGGNYRTFKNEEGYLYRFKLPGKIKEGKYCLVLEEIE